jgi:hypothetical protein
VQIHYVRGPAGTEDFDAAFRPDVANLSATDALLVAGGSNFHVHRVKFNDGLAAPAGRRCNSVREGCRRGRAFSSDG